MKILYAIQGTGNGHMCRAMEVVPRFMQHARVDILVSGTQADVRLPFTVKHRCTGLGFIFGRTGGIDRWATLRSAARGGFIREVRTLPVERYDLVVTDFEPVSAWAARLRNVPCFGLSHQAAVLKEHAPRPEAVDRTGITILKRYAPARKDFGFHFARYDEATFTPVIRRTVRERPVNDYGHYTVYLPAYPDRSILEVLSKCGGTRWEVFSKHARTTYTYGNVHVSPVRDDHFVRSMANSSGVLCGAGFETPAEALFMGKKLMVIPMFGQFEQQCNAAALRQMGVPVLPYMHTDHLERIEDWLASDDRATVHYPDTTHRSVDEVLSAYCQLVSRPTEAPGTAQGPLLAEL